MRSEQAGKFSLRPKLTGSAPTYPLIVTVDCCCAMLYHPFTNWTAAISAPKSEPPLPLSFAATRKCRSNNKYELKANFLLENSSIVVKTYVLSTIRKKYLQNMQSVIGESESWKIGADWYTWRKWFLFLNASVCEA